ncbi:uncharacterized protein LOC112510095 [Cynara cardunculus var. scolymus]|uniref:ZC3H15/TMA46 family C-terminal domain-containing protein n=1 Tax=Cynara cardunculus var. scolymus TaxID=59895 RepID=A0A103YE05_CYNCS|nr:uncharacterized protein LOC112510095 [Cynara cardunculus var. scolymus]KVI07360.1 hypothetical protein Ccrd_014381 [Cynara cardunculus var. scolymus]
MGEEQQQHEEDDGNQKSGPNSSAPLTQAQFLLWKTQKDAEAATKKAEVSRKLEADVAAGLVQMNGRELFKHEPWVFDNNLY